MYELRWYQEEAIEQTWTKMRTRPGNPVIVLPTGAGKSIVLAEMMRQALTRWTIDDRKIRVLLLTHQKELIQQNHEKLTTLAPDLNIGINSASVGVREYAQPAIFGGIQSVYKNADLFLEHGLINVVFIDEAHLISTAASKGMYRTFLEKLRQANPRLKVIGLTATPYRLQGGLICRQHPDEHEKLFDYVSYELNVNALIDEGYVSQPVNLGIKCEVDREDLKKASTGDFDVRSQEEAFEGVQVDLLNDMTHRVTEKGLRSVLVFCSSRAHGKSLLAAMQDTGHSVEYLDGETDKKVERPAILDRFKSGQTQYLINIGVLTTGFDAPNIDLVVLMRSTTSPGLYVQMVGRGLRVTETKKKFYVLDYGGNIRTHGPIDDIDTDTLFDGEDDAEKKTGWECRACGALNPERAKECLECGASRPKPQKREIKLEQADESEILKKESSRLRRRVYDYYFDWHKSKSNPTARPCIRVTYKFRFGKSSKWVFPESEGRSRSGFESWWRRITGQREAPTSTDAAIQILQNTPDEELAVPDFVEIVQKANNKFSKVEELWDESA